MIDNKEWWMPIGNVEEDRLDWLCDHMGDANDVMYAMWEEICRLRPELPEEGFKSEE